MIGLVVFGGRLGYDVDSSLYLIWEDTILEAVPPLSHTFTEHGLHSRCLYVQLTSPDADITSKVLQNELLQQLSFVKHNFV